MGIGAHIGCGRLPPRGHHHVLKNHPRAGLFVRAHKTPRRDTKGYISSDALEGESLRGKPVRAGEVVGDSAAVLDNDIRVHGSVAGILCGDGVRVLSGGA